MLTICSHATRVQKREKGGRRSKFSSPHPQAPLPQAPCPVCLAEASVHTLGGASVRPLQCKSDGKRLTGPYSHRPHASKMPVARPRPRPPLFDPYPRPLYSDHNQQLACTPRHLRRSGPSVPASPHIRRSRKHHTRTVHPDTPVVNSPLVGVGIRAVPFVRVHSRV